MRRLFLLPLLFWTFSTASAQTESPVRAVLFYSPTCPHCHQVIENDLPVISGAYNTSVEWSYLPDTADPPTSDLPPMVRMQGDALEIVFINTMTQLGSDLYGIAIEQYQIPDDRLGVPALFIGDTHLVGSLEIPNQLPGLIDEGLAAGGTDWPDIPGIDEQIPEMVPMPEAEATDGPAPTQEGNPGPDPSPSIDAVVPPALDIPDSEPSVIDKVLRDPIGNTASMIVLIGMFLSVIGVGAYVTTVQENPVEKSISWLIPLLAIVGLVVAGYLSFVESTGVEAVCGPVGDCNAVQSSPYAKLFGLIPVGLLGFLAYLAMLGAWLVARFASGKAADIATLAVFGMAVVGTLFSIYLTFLEPFVIGATCAWCLSSAIIITVIMWLATRPAVLATQRLRS